MGKTEIIWTQTSGPTSERNQPETLRANGRRQRPVLTPVPGWTRQDGRSWSPAARAAGEQRPDSPARPPASGDLGRSELRDRWSSPLVYRVGPCCEPSTHSPCPRRTPRARAPGWSSARRVRLPRPCPHNLLFPTSRPSARTGHVDLPSWSAALLRSHLPHSSTILASVPSTTPMD